MGYSLFKIIHLKDNFKRQFKAFVGTLGSAVSRGDKITFADNDITYALKLQHDRLTEKGFAMEYELTDRDTESDAIVGSEWKDTRYESYVCNEQYSVRRKITKNGKKLFADKKRSILYTTITDVISGVHPDDETVTCPNCGSVSTIAQIQGGCPYCGTQYKMDDLFPKITSYYFLEDVGMAGNEGKKGMAAFIVITILALFAIDIVYNIGKLSSGDLGPLLTLIPLLPLGAILGYFIYSIYLIVRLIAVGSSQSSGKWGTIGSRSKFEQRMKAISPLFSYEYFASKAISLIKTSVFSPNEQELLFYKGERLDPGFKDIIDMNYGGALGLAGFKEENGRVTVATDAFFDVLHAQGDRIVPKKEKYRAIFQRRVDIPIDPNFSMTKIQCPSCGGSFNAVQNKMCPFCGTAYDIESQDWVLLSLKKAK